MHNTTEFWFGVHFPLTLTQEQILKKNVIEVNDKFEMVHNSAKFWFWVHFPLTLKIPRGWWGRCWGRREGGKKCICSAPTGDRDQKQDLLCSEKIQKTAHLGCCFDKK